jgi:formylglycine-generating enzyme required for sulfatase activity
LNDLALKNHFSNQYLHQIMSKKPYFLVFTLFLIQQISIAQSLPLSVLPKNVQKELKDFVYVNQTEFTIGLYTGWDSLQLHRPHKITVNSYLINRFETSVGEFRAFYTATGLGTDKPDSILWTTEFPYSYNTMVYNYFSHPTFSQYPVSCITWEQAMRYCGWKTNQINVLLANTDYEIDIRLPSEEEWELAALAIMPPKPTQNERMTDRQIFPWNGHFMQQVGKDKLQFMCNGGNIEALHNYILSYYPADGYMYTAPVEAFSPNGFGLYQMAGNVGEWTANFYRVDSVQLAEMKQEILKLGLDDAEDYFRNRFVSEFPYKKYDDYTIVKGGSWFDGPFYQQCGVKKIQHPTKASSTIGFRPVCIVRKKT